MAPTPLTVMVTGASTGIGLALARTLLRDTPHQVVLTARRPSLARFTAEGIVENERVAIVALDVTNQGERRAAVAAAEQRFGAVDVLVNNAGVAYRSVLEHVTEDDFLDQMDVNYVGPVELTRLVLPGMRARRRGSIINLSSVGGMMAMPTMAIYSASKFALEGATEALYYEVRPWGIKVSLIQPGFVHSESFEHTRLTAASERSNADLGEAYHAHYEHMSPFIARLMHRARATPESIAKRIVRTIHRRSPPLRVPVTIDAWVFGYLRRLLPRSLYHWLLYRSLPGVRQWGDAKALPGPYPEPSPPAISAEEVGGR
ncbi:MAG TPA: SDR family oxidoreductase [Kofleriaceae bacterium]|nr:SDR family oxidoreductase [Kofleriaceae bacterium]